MIDVRITGHGSVFIVHPASKAAQEWLADNIGGETIWLGHALAVEARYIDSLVDGMRADGLVIE